MTQFCIYFPNTMHVVYLCRVFRIWDVLFAFLIAVIFLPSSFGLLLFSPYLGRVVKSWYTKSKCTCRHRVVLSASMTNLAYEIVCHLNRDLHDVGVSFRARAAQLKIVKWIRVTTKKLIRWHFLFVYVYDCVICWLPSFKRPFDNVDSLIQN